MKKNGILVLIGFFALILGVNAQDYAFKVMANKGSNEVKTGSAWQALKTGDKLGKDDELKVSDNAYVALVHNSGKPLELKEAKTYKIADLAAKVGPGASVVSKYTDFILSSNSAEARKNRLSATGAVHRGIGDIKVLLPPNQFADTFSDLIYIGWDSKVAGPYEVLVKNMFGDELRKIETTENTVQINRNDPKFENGEILIEVRSKGDKKKISEQHLIKRLSAERQAAVKKLIVSDLGEDIYQETALNKYILAAFYEQNRLFIDAIAAYEQAIKLAPDVPTYREAYDEFLQRNRLREIK
ncbi:MAG: hypothetical protein ACKOEV_01040 [Cytophagales bacterium]